MIMNVILRLLLATLAFGFLQSCNTTAGLGQDVRKLRNDIERTADKAR